MQWGVESVTAIAGAQAGLPSAGTSAESPLQTSAPGAFANMMQSKLQDLNASVGAAETALRDLASGKAVEPQEAMISMERARISVLTFVQLRNKLVESYQDIMRMQL